ncbi:hypothetical protein EV421DRAFT_1926781 [Armillaria borealis]|uniref:DUF6533 domain-containing protein n=1 Tax=Armillaria borealis TaxID=47425 RepID=A0AA39JS10_9AGAR|nr:hypothetical protein EV421DRAFT_1926781 [Armillaria borealis]
MSITSVGQVLFAKYTPPAAAILILWDHCLTLDEEVATMWRSFNGHTLTKIVYIMNRYFTEVVMLYTSYVLSGLRGNSADTVSAWCFRNCYTDANVITRSELCTHCAKMVWLFTISATVLAGILQFFITLRVYRLWDHRQTIRKTLLAVFLTCITGVVTLSVKTVLIALRSLVQLPLSVEICAVDKVPETMAYVMGIMLAFNLFVICITIYNALEIPRRSENEIFETLRRDGARIYLLVSLLWMLLLTASVTVRMRSFFSILMLVWSLMANIASRMHLRIENLGLSVTGYPVVIYTGQEV